MPTWDYVYDTHLNTDEFRVQLLLVFLASLGVFGNSVILYVIMRDRKMRERKEYKFPLFVAVLEWLRCFADIFFFFYYLTMVKIYEQWPNTLGVICMLTPHQFLWNFTDRAIAVANLIISVDRYIATTAVMKYMALGNDYVRKMVFAGSVPMAILTTALLYDSTNYPQHPACCCWSAIGESLGVLLFVWVIGFDLTAAGIYVVIAFKMKQQTEQVETDEIKARYKARQLRVTKMVAWVILSTLILDVIPMFMWLGMMYGKIPYRYITVVPTVAGVMLISGRWNNLILYVIKNDEVRSAVFKMFGLKQGKVNDRSTHSNVGRVQVAK